MPAEDLLDQLLAEPPGQWAQPQQQPVAQPFVVSPQDRTQLLRVVGEHITVLASAAQTGSYEIFFQAGPEGSGPPPHNHPWDEAFYVLRGEVAFGVAIFLQPR
jgi:quercetin dioxygenase-like cupin family protein